VPKQTWEAQAIDRFLRFMLEKYEQAWRVVGEDVVVDPETNKNFDYQIESEGKLMAVEIFRFIDNGADIARSKAWQEIATKIADELAILGIREYWMRAPRFNVPKMQRTKYARDKAEMLAREISRRPNDSEFEVDGFRVRKHAGLSKAVFSTYPSGGTYDPFGIARSVLAEMLPEKNAQLATTNCRRVVFILNCGSLAGLDNILHACARIDFGCLSNIDDIYFEISEGTIEHIFDRNVFDALASLADPPTPELEALYLRWLTCRIYQKDRAGFLLVKKRSERLGNALWLSPEAREGVVLYGEDFVDSQQWDDAQWIIRHFKDDPDPHVSQSDSQPHDRSLSDWHARRGEKVWFISGVRAQVCWLLKRMIVANRSEFFPEALGVIETLARDENIYVRQQAVVPLVDLVNRRHAIVDGNRLVDDGTSLGISTLVLEMMRANTCFPTVLEYLVGALMSLRDVSEEVGNEVVATLLRFAPEDTANEVAWFLIYLAVFRESRFPGHGSFDSLHFKEILTDQIRGLGREDIRCGAIWQLMKVSEEQPDIDFAPLVLYVTAFAEGEYSDGSFLFFYTILEKQLRSAPDILVPAFKTVLAKELAAAAEPHGRYFHSGVGHLIDELFDMDRLGDVLSCVEIMLPFIDRVPGLPTGGINGWLDGCTGSTLESRAERAREILRRSTQSRRQPI